MDYKKEIIKLLEDWTEGMEYMDSPIGDMQIGHFADKLNKIVIKSQQEQIQKIRKWAKQKNLCGDLVATSDLMRYLDSLAPSNEVTTGGDE